jgi:hypothetical protein
MSSKCDAGSFWPIGLSPSKFFGLSWIQILNIPENLNAKGISLGSDFQTCITNSFYAALMTDRDSGGFNMKDIMQWPQAPASSLANIPNASQISESEAAYRIDYL